MNKCIDCYYYTDGEKEVWLPKFGAKGEFIAITSQQCHYDRVTIDTTPDNYCKDWKER